MTFFCIIDKESSLGFQMSGVCVREVSTRGQALEAFRTVMAMDDAGVILVSDKAARFIREELDDHSVSQKFPLVLQIPSKGTSGEGKSAAELLKQAIGISV